jgi:tetratricopeptide (TPR) repeat protein
MAKVSLRAYNREIETMMDRGQLDEGVAHCRHILKTFPKHLETYRLLGKLYLEQKRHPEAVDIFSRVLVAEPSDFVAHVGMSIIRDEENKLDDAIWHMERAFENQPSNAAVQAELQRLYGRRDGVQPPRIRMTRGALARMYVQGGLYPQAISEIRSILREDPGRSDMQALLAVACYRSGQKNDAADAASALLRRYPYCLDANRVLVEILGADRPEGAQIYRQRVVELDPYAAQVNGTVFQSNEVSDAAVTLEHLDWTGQPVRMQTDWETTQAIRLEGGEARDEQPDWLRGERSLADTVPPPAKPLHVPAFDDSMSAPAESTARAGEADIPEFMRAAGWTASTGAFDESKSSISTEEPEAVSPAQPIEEGDLPDWVKAMAPPEVTQSPAEAEEELPDWIKNIGLDALASQPVSSAPFEEQPDWLKDITAEPGPTSPAPSAEEPDWLKDLAPESAPTPSAASADQPDWLSQLSAEPESAPLSQESSAFDFLDQIESEPEQPAPSEPEAAMIDTGSLGTSEQERDDSFAWLESLAARQGASEGLLTKPEERMEEEPEWVKQAKSLSLPPAQPAARSTDDLKELGKSEQERDDSFAWLESLAARQGASEGLLTKPEERMEEEPEWVKQAKSLSLPPSQPVLQESASADTEMWLQGLEAEELAPEPRKDETGVWLKSLEEAESLPVQPVQEESKVVSDMAAWLRSLDEEEAVSAKDETGIWLKSLEGIAETPAQPVPSDELPEWMKDVEAEQAPAAEPAVPAEEAAETSGWMSAIQEPVIQETPVSEAEEFPDWLSGLEEKETKVAELAVSAEEAEASGWMSAIEEPPAQEVPASETEELPGWLSGLEEEKEPISVPPLSEELPAWLRDETAEAAAEPSKIEPTHAGEWRPLDEAQSEIVAPVSEARQFEPAPPALELVPEQPALEPEPVSEVRPAKPPAPYKEPVTRKGTGTLKVPVDMLLGQARNELSRSNVPGALETYAKLIRKGRFLDEVIFDLREALYRFPVEVSIWQALGDAYMRGNRLQDALDAYTKAEELLR